MLPDGKVNIICRWREQDFDNFFFAGNVSILTAHYWFRVYIRL